MSKRLTLAIIACLLLAACSINVPTLSDKITHPDGRVEERKIRIPTIASWPATTDLAKQRATLGKTLSLGTDGLREETGSTNVADTVRELRLFIQSLR